jgi:hypothetical protein
MYSTHGLRFVALPSILNLQSTAVSVFGSPVIYNTTTTNFNMTIGADAKQF